MATAVGIIGGNGSSCSPSWINLKERKKMTMRDRVKVCCVASSSSSPPPPSSVTVMDPYRTLRIQHDASESEVKKAFRKLALQYHPDVCRGSDCGVQFHQISEAYDIAMSNLREDIGKSRMTYELYDDGIDEPMRGMNDADWDMWEEWMGWEGAGIRDYSSHINPYL